ncbi:MAG: hypothetical protein J0I65_27070 [Variovorax sp.]|nr:hypothetical protein [Variovorax sp.]
MAKKSADLQFEMLIPGRTRRMQGNKTTASRKRKLLLLDIASWERFTGKYLLDGSTSESQQASPEQQLNLHI